MDEQEYGQLVMTPWLATHVYDLCRCVCMYWRATPRAVCITLAGLLVVVFGLHFFFFSRIQSRQSGESPLRTSNQSL